MSNDHQDTKIGVFLTKSEISGKIWSKSREVCIRVLAKHNKKRQTGDGIAAWMDKTVATDKNYRWLLHIR